MTATIAESPSVWGTTFFCDDLRYEAQGTQTLVGVYNAHLLVSGEFPILLPKFALLIKIFEDPENMLSGTGSLKIFVPGEEHPVFDMPMNFENRHDPKLLFDEHNSYDGLTKTISGSIPLMFSPFTLKEEGSIRVRLYANDIEYRVGALIVKRAANPALQPLQSPPDPLAS